jgi:hypothetical protein
MMSTRKRTRAEAFRGAESGDEKPPGEAVRDDDGARLTNRASSLSDPTEWDETALERAQEIWDGLKEEYHESTYA